MKKYFVIVDSTHDGVETWTCYYFNEEFILEDEFDDINKLTEKLTRLYEKFKRTVFEFSIYLLDTYNKLSLISLENALMDTGNHNK